MSLSVKLKITAIVAAVLWALLWALPVGGGNDAPQKVANSQLLPLLPSAP
jgi:hypothetical protein